MSKAFDIVVIFIETTYRKDNFGFLQPHEYKECHHLHNSVASVCEWAKFNGYLLVENPRPRQSEFSVEYADGSKVSDDILEEIRKRQKIWRDIQASRPWPQNLMQVL